ncbi:hypothetical protein PDJAM_G00070200 [Pangasius djambal]|uniref:Uncharacterized protein n=1 Tax=Pangasius djambal TaxID=1691987 RepID=A0ACC5Z0T6_9TELE|nr:hypothetical protein [Pangasius djambal]
MRAVIMNGEDARRIYKKVDDSVPFARRPRLGGGSGSLQHRATPSRTGKRRGPTTRKDLQMIPLRVSRGRGNPGSSSDV